MTTYDADTRTRGQRWADAVTRFGGSWTFICTFVGSSAVWVLWNSLAAGRPDPYPFLFLNMLLTVISTFQQPFVLLSQNRQNEEDRQRDEEDRAQLRLLHKRLDDIDAKLGQIKAEDMRRSGQRETAATWILVFGQQPVVM